MKKKRILITNDDGIDADGIRRLAQEALRYGEVWVVAPDTERSAASHSITLRKPIDIYPYEGFGIKGVHAYSCKGTPADCIRVGALGVMPMKPDIVMSGINYGYNAATDVQYSATVGAALEAAFQGFHAIAFSEGAGGAHETTDAYLDAVIEELIDKPLAYGQIFNVNFPDIPISECRGILRDRRVSRGMFYRDSYDEIDKLPDGGSRYMVNGRYNEDAEEDTDFRAIVDGYVSIGTVNNLS